MTRLQILEKLNLIFKDVFDDASIAVNDTTTADDIEGWDSLEHINLVVAVENEFDINLSMADVIAFKNIGDMVTIIEKKLK